MGGGSKKTTNVTNTGLGDTQYKNLQTGQNNLGNQITSLDANATKRFDAADKSLATANKGIASANTGIAGLASGQKSIGSQLTNTQNAISSGFDSTGKALTGISGQIDTGFAGVDESLTGLGTQMNTGFEGVNSNVDARFGTLNENLTSGFGTVDSRLQDMTGAMSAGFDTATNSINTNLDAARTDINQNVNTGFEATQNQLTDTQAAILAGQGGLGNQLTQVGGNLDAYYSGLAAQNAEQLAAQGQLQTGLNDYVNQYNKDNKLAVQQRADLVQGVTSGFDSVRDDMAQASDAATSERMGLGQQLQGVGTAVGEAAQQSETQFSDVAKQIAVGFNDGTQESQNMRMDFINRLNTVRNVLSTQGDQLDSNIRDQYGKMASSFDDQGELISRSLDAQGNTIGRALDSQGNLLLATFDQYGGRINQQSLNLDQMMSQLDMLGYVPTSGAASGNIAPQYLNTRPAAVRSGIASPFTSTR